MTPATLANVINADEQIEILSLEEEGAIAIIRDVFAELEVLRGADKIASIEKALIGTGARMEHGKGYSSLGIFSMGGARFAVRDDMLLCKCIEIRFEPCSA